MIDSSRKYEVMCDCHGEILLFEEWDLDDPFICVHMYYSSDYGFWGRIKAGLKYIRSGEAAFNEMIMSKDRLPGLIKFLESIVEAGKCQVKE